jgi:hypothetical protein
VIAGLIVAQIAIGKLEHFNLLGFILIASVHVGMMYLIHRRVPEAHAIERAG